MQPAVAEHDGKPPEELLLPLLVELDTVPLDEPEDPPLDDPPFEELAAEPELLPLPDPPSGATSMIVCPLQPDTDEEA